MSIIRTASDEIKQFCRQYSANEENSFVRQLREGGLTDEQIVIVIETIERTCPLCWDNERGCQCDSW